MKKYAGIAFLAAGFAFSILGNGRYAVAFAAWVAPGLLLCFSRKARGKWVYPAIAAALGLACQITFWKFSSSNPRNLLFYLPLLMGALLALPYWLDRLLRDRFHGVVRSMIFPVAYTALEFIYVSFSPLGSTGSLAYTQTGLTPLVQIASVTGIYGVTFLICWFASVAADLLHNEDPAGARRAALVYGVVLLSVLTFGGVRLLLPQSGGTVRVSGLHVYDLRSRPVQDTWDNVSKDPQAFRNMTDRILNNLLAATAKEAAAGSKIVIWSELSPLMLYEDQDKYINAIRQCARENRILLVACPYILSQDLQGKDTNKLLIVDEQGEVVLEHLKYGGAMFDNIVEGDRKLRIVPTAYGNLSGVICWDADFPSVMRQEGRLGADMLLTPAADWKEVDPIHSAPAYFRGIENGMSVLRQTVNGLSFASDSIGRYLARMDHFSSSDWVTVVQLPTHRSFTLYPIIGDSFALLDCLACLALGMVGITRYRRTRRSAPR